MTLGIAVVDVLQQTNCETGFYLKIIEKYFESFNFNSLFFVTSSDHRYFETEINFKDIEIH